MKKLIIIVTLMAFTLLVKAQETEGDLKSGKYFKNAKIDNFIGSWVSNEEGKEIEFEITTKKVHYKSINLDYYGDAIYIKIIKYMNNGEDFSKKLTEPFMLLGRETRLSRIQNDPITNNEISIQLDSKDENNLVIKAHTLYATKTGTFFHTQTRLTRKK